MVSQNRRAFLKQFGAFASFCIGSQVLGPASLFAQNDITAIGSVKPLFEMLAVGDSIVWGQGLKQENKFTWQVADWLEKQVFADQAKVNLKVKAHSGSTIELPGNEFDDGKYKDTRRLLQEFDEEINVSTPTVIDQVTKAFIEYREENKNPKDVRLVLLDGGINDVGAIRILNPLTKNINLETDAERYCYRSMTNLLGHAARSFPNARLVVTGYYPLISEDTSLDEPLRAVLNIFGLGGFSTWLTRHLRRALRNAERLDPAYYVRKAMAENSKVWYEASNKNLARAVTDFNQKDKFPPVAMANNSANRVFFTEILFEDRHSFAASDTHLWGIEKDFKLTPFKTNDELFDYREPVCRAAGKQIYRGKLNQKRELFICHRAGLFHPNKEGAKVYAEAIKTVLSPVFSRNSFVG